MTLVYHKLTSKQMQNNIYRVNRIAMAIQNIKSKIPTIQTGSSNYINAII